MAKEGDRVGAILEANHKEIKFLGFGVYEGFKIPTDDVIILGIQANTIHKYTNPCIKLDDGSTVWGCQCWWGPEEDVKKTLKDGRKVFNVKIEVKKYLNGHKK